MIPVAAVVVSLAGCAHRQPATVLAPFQGTGAFVIRAGERSFGGAAVVEVSDATYTLLGLTPSGTALFTVRDDGTGLAVTSPDPAMSQVLGRIPVERDLWLLYRLRCDDRCRAEGGTLTVVDDVLRWRGAGGPATVTRDGARSTLVDARRGYTLTVAGAP